MSEKEFNELFKSGRVGEALDEAKARLAQARASDDGAAVARALLDEARAQWAKGERDEAVMTVDEAITAARRAFGPRDPRVVDALEAGAEIAAGANMPNSADARFRAAIEVLDAAGVRGATRGHALLLYGLFRESQGDGDGAARALLAVIDAVRGEKVPEERALFAQALTAMARLALNSKRYEQSRALADRALERWAALKTALRAEVGEGMTLVGVSALHMGEPDVAEDFLRAACEVLEHCKGDVRAKLGPARAGHGEALAALGRKDEARKAIESALDCYREGALERLALEERVIELSR